MFKGYWNAPELTAQAFTEDGWYKTGDLGHYDDAGRLILSGRIKDMIVLPNGFNVYPEDIENALRIADLRDAVVIETAPGRIEAVVLALEGEDAAATKARVEAAVKAANATLGPNQRIAGWRQWPDDGLPADPHPQDQARSDPEMDCHRDTADAGRRPGLTAAGAPGSARWIRDHDGTGTPVPSVSSAAWMSGCSGSSAPSGTHEYSTTVAPTSRMMWRAPRADWTLAGPVAR